MATTIPQNSKNKKQKVELAKIAGMISEKAQF